MVLLSFKADLRACEIAGLQWEMVLGSDGEVGDQVLVSRTNAKGGSARLIPTHLELKRSLKLLQGAPKNWKRDPI